MVLWRLDDFEMRGRHFTLYGGGSFVLFEEHGEEAEGLGTIIPKDDGFEVAVWWRPEVTMIASTLPEAIRKLVEVADADG
ncbi:hypothetical protein [Leifsonia sp. AG29]|uniref:hypothetical protein n=1 Tax=Leifsonia sp. AG29 TaxID=2598860 RepID=UPI00131BB09E|nr:hypothetical protein [Leifsonia sp. AG29]